LQGRIGKSQLGPLKVYRGRSCGPQNRGAPARRAPRILRAAPARDRTPTGASALPSTLSNTRMARKSSRFTTGQKRVGEEIVNRGAAGVAGVARAEVPPGLDGERWCRGAGGLPGWRPGRGVDLDQGGLGSGDVQVVQQRRGEPLIHQDAAMLGLLRNLTTYQLPSSAPADETGRLLAFFVHAGRP